MPRHRPTSMDLIACAAGGITLGRLTRVIGPTVAAYGNDVIDTGVRADLLVPEDVMDVRAIQSRVDRGRIARRFDNNLMSLLEPEVRFWGMFTSWPADHHKARPRKKSRRKGSSTTQLGRITWSFGAPSGRLARRRVLTNQLDWLWMAPGLENVTTEPEAVYRWDYGTIEVQRLAARNLRLSSPMSVHSPSTVEPRAKRDFATPMRRAARRGGLARAITTGCIFGAVLACLVDLARVVWGPNFHPVVPGRVYRSAQPTGPRLEEYVDRHGIRTVISLRGPQHKNTWLAETRAAQARGLSLEVVTLSPVRLPSPSEVGRLIEAFDRSEPPILIHCRQGADRTGLAATTYLLLYTDSDCRTAGRHCSLRFGHVGLRREAAADSFFEQYDQWLAEHGQTHTQARFRQWATTEYCPGPHRARLELVAAPDHAEVGEPFHFVLRAHNTSHQPWHFRSGGAGVRAEYVVDGPDGSVAYRDRAGLLDRTVAPGESIDLRLPVPAPASAGRYQLFVQLADPEGTFVQYGSEPLTHEWYAHSPAAPRNR